MKQTMEKGQKVVSNGERLTRLIETWVNFWAYWNTPFSNEIVVIQVCSSKLLR